MADNVVTLAPPTGAAPAHVAVETAAPDLGASLVAELTPREGATEGTAGEVVPEETGGPPRGPDGKFVSPYSPEELRKLESVRDEIRAAAEERRQARETERAERLALQQERERLEALERVRQSVASPSQTQGARDAAPELGSPPTLSWEDAQDERRLTQWQQDYAAWIEARSDRRSTERVAQLVEERLAPLRQTVLQTEQQRQLALLQQRLDTRLTEHPEADREYVLHHVVVRHAQEPNRSLDTLIDELVLESVDVRRQRYPELLKRADPAFIVPALKDFLTTNKDPVLRRMVLDVAKDMAQGVRPGGNLAPVEAGATPPPLTPAVRQKMDGTALIEELTRLSQTEPGGGVGRVT